MGPDLWGKCLWCKNNLLRLLADIGEDTAVDIEHVAVDGVTGMRSQEHGRTTQFLRLEPASGRRLGADERVEGMA